MKFIVAYLIVRNTYFISGTYSSLEVYRILILKIFIFECDDIYYSKKLGVSPPPRIGENRIHSSNSVLKSSATVDSGGKECSRGGRVGRGEGSS